MPVGLRTAKVVFLPKPYKPTYRKAKMLTRQLKILPAEGNGVADRSTYCIRHGILMLPPKQHADQVGLSTDTELHYVVLQIEHCLAWGQNVLGCFLDIQGAFDNALVKVIEKALYRKLACFHASDKESIFTSGGCTVTINLGRDCPKGKIISALY